jgi:hypothetical protein
MEAKMKAIVNGKRYDTEKAVLIGRDCYGGSRSDFQWWEAGLYKTPRSGAYFLAGRGGAMTRWARRVDGGGHAGGEGIFPMSAAEALEWAERYLSVEEVEQHFGGVIEDA